MRVRTSLNAVTDARPARHPRWVLAALLCAGLPGAAARAQDSVTLEELAVEGGVLAPEGDEGARRREMVDLLNKSIDMLELSVRSKNCLDSENVALMRDLVGMSEPELLKVRNFGKTSLKEVKSKLAALGLSLGMNVEEYK